MVQKAQPTLLLGNALTSVGQAERVRCRPIPIPTLDEFILLHKVVRAALRLQPDMLDMIEGARRAFGWNVLGARASTR